MKFIVTEGQLTGLLNYLTTRPWGEVNNLIAGFSKLEKLEEEKEVDKDLKSEPKA